MRHCPRRISSSKSGLASSTNHSIWRGLSRQVATERILLRIKKATSCRRSVLSLMLIPESSSVRQRDTLRRRQVSHRHGSQQRTITCRTCLIRLSKSTACRSHPPQPMAWDTRLGCWVRRRQVGPLLTLIPRAWALSNRSTIGKEQCSIRAMVYETDWAPPIHATWTSRPKGWAARKSWTKASGSVALANEWLRPPIVARRFKTC